eukprot:scaffold114_cov361-Pinguiococcus_pyrenoidosus.AAC.9
MKPQRAQRSPSSSMLPLRRVKMTPAANTMTTYARAIHVMIGRLASCSKLPSPQFGSAPEKRTVKTASAVVLARKATSRSKSSGAARLYAISAKRVTADSTTAARPKPMMQDEARQRREDGEYQRWREDDGSGVRLDDAAESEVDRGGASDLQVLNKLLDVIEPHPIGGDDQQEARERHDEDDGRHEEAPPSRVRERALRPQVEGQRNHVHLEDQLGREEHDHGDQVALTPLGEAVVQSVFLHLVEVLDEHRGVSEEPPAQADGQLGREERPDQGLRGAGVVGPRAGRDQQARHLRGSARAVVVHDHAEELDQEAAERQAVPVAKERPEREIVHEDREARVDARRDDILIVGLPAGHHQAQHQELHAQEDHLHRSHRVEHVLDTASEDPHRRQLVGQHAAPDLRGQRALRVPEEPRHFMSLLPQILRSSRASPLHLWASDATRVSLTLRVVASNRPRITAPRRTPPERQSREPLWRSSASAS